MAAGLVLLKGSVNDKQPAYFDHDVSGRSCSHYRDLTSDYQWLSHDSDVKDFLSLQGQLPYDGHCPSCELATLVRTVALPRGCKGSARAKRVEEGGEPAVGIGRRPTRQEDPEGREKRGRMMVGARGILGRGGWFKHRHLHLVNVHRYRIPPPVRMPRLVVYRLAYCPSLPPPAHAFESWRLEVGSWKLEVGSPS